MPEIPNASGHVVHDLISLTKTPSFRSTVPLDRQLASTTRVAPGSQMTRVMMSRQPT